MKASIEQISPVKKRLTVEVEADEVDRKIEEAYRELKRGQEWTVFGRGKCLATSSNDISGTR